MECVFENITVHYEVFGEGKPVIILPGWGLNTHFTAYETEPSFEGREGWQRIYIDPPGHGKTPGKDWITNQDQMLEVVLACIDHLTAGARFSLIGFSLGGYLARGVRFQRGELIDGIALIIPVMIAQDAKRDVPPYQVLIEDPTVKADLQPEETDLYDMAVVHTHRWLEHQRSFPQVPEQERGDFEFLSAIRNSPEKYAFSFDVDDVREPFMRPALIIAARQDANVGYRDAWNVLERYPRATYVVFDRAGHELEDKQELIQSLMKDWLDRVEEAIG